MGRERWRLFTKGGRNYASQKFPELKAILLAESDFCSGRGSGLLRHGGEKVDPGAVLVGGGAEAGVRRFHPCHGLSARGLPAGG